MAWLTVSALIQPKGVLSGWGQGSVQVNQFLYTKHAHHCNGSVKKFKILVPYKYSNDAKKMK